MQLICQRCFQPRCTTIFHMQERLNFDNEVADIERAIAVRRHNLRQLQVMKDEAEQARDKARVSSNCKVKVLLMVTWCDSTHRECYSIRKKSVLRTRRRETRNSRSTEKKQKRRKNLQIVLIVGQAEQGVVLVQSQYCLIPSCLQTQLRRLSIQQESDRQCKIAHCIEAFARYQ